ncbi:MAG: serine hydrolase domain-containing protein [Planctomycetota bacterium]
MRTLLLFGILIVTLTPGRADAQALTDRASVKANLTLLDAWIDSQVAYKQLPGLAIAIVHDQETVFKKAYGYADVNTKPHRRLTLDTKFRLASQSKLFTALAILKLRDAKKLRLDDPVSDYLPWLKKRSSDTVPVTIRQMLTHSSGLHREGADSPFWTNGSFPSIDEIREGDAVHESVFEPASTWKYSNLNFVLLGEVVSSISGVSFHDFIREELFLPIGMPQTAMNAESFRSNEIAIGYGRRLPDGSREAFSHADVRGLAAAAGLTSSVNDMIEFLKWQFRVLRKKDSGDVLASSTLHEMQRTHWVRDDWSDGWGLGFHAIKRKSGPIVGHMGLLPGFKTATFIDVNTSLGVIVYANSLDAEPYPGETVSVVDRVFDWIGPSISNTPGNEDEKLNDDWIALRGIYRSIFVDTLVLEIGGGLTLVNINSSDPMSTIRKLEPIDGKPNHFRVIEGDPFYSLGETAAFSLQDGRAISLKLGAGVLQRIK